MNQRWKIVAGPPIAAFGLAFIVTSIVLLLIGKNPLDAYRMMITYLDSTDSVVSVINRAAPYYVSGLAAAIGFKMGLFNIGVDGQYRMAVMLTAWFGAKIDAPAVIHLGLIMAFAMLVGGAWAAIPGVLKVTRGVNEVISTILLNYVATGLISYLFLNYLRTTARSDRDLVPKTKLLDGSARMPDLNTPIEKLGFHFPAGTRLYGYLIVAIAAGVIVHVMVSRTRFGFDLRMSGANAAAARSSGVNAKAMIVRTMIISGALAGLLGMQPLLSEFYQYDNRIPLQLGFTGITVALLGRNHPGGVAVAAFVWATLEQGALGFTSDIPTEIIRIMQATLLLSAVIAYEVVNRRALAAATRQASSAPVAVGAAS